MRTCRTLLLAFTVALGCTAGAQAGAAGEQLALQKLFAQPALTDSMFAPNFLAKIPVSDVQAYVDSYKQRLGAPTAVVKDGFEWALVSPKGSIKVTIAFDQQGRISSLLFHDELSADNLAALERLLAADSISPDWFEASYLEAVPAPKVERLLADMHGKLGAFVRVDTQAGKYIAIFERGRTHAQISADSERKIDYLAFSKD